MNHPGKMLSGAAPFPFGKECCYFFGLGLGEAAGMSSKKVTL